MEQALSPANLSVGGVCRVLFPRAFAGEPNPYRVVNVTKTLASFERTILSGAPTLRIIALTAPYMHDGSIATGEVVEHYDYAAGGRTIEHGPRAGVGRDNPAKDPLFHGIPMTAQNRADLVAFLDSLTDESVLHDPRLADPW